MVCSSRSSLISSHRLLFRAMMFGITAILGSWYVLCIILSLCT